MNYFHPNFCDIDFRSHKIHCECALLFTVSLVAYVTMFLYFPNYQNSYHIIGYDMTFILKSLGLLYTLNVQQMKWHSPSSEKVTFRSIPKSSEGYI